MGLLEVFGQRGFFFQISSGLETESRGLLEGLMVKEPSNAFAHKKAPNRS